MSQQELLPCRMGRFEQVPRHTFGDDRYRLAGIEGSLIIRFSIDKDKIEDRPELIIGLSYIHRNGRLSR